jgi:glycosyltransferase involved in cell wall biosynthesis
MIHRIPLLASAVGGLPEAAGAPELLVRGFQSADAWASKLDRLLSRTSARDANVEQGMRLARRFTTGRATEMLEAELAHIAGGSKRPARPDRVIALCGEKAANTAFAMINANWSEARVRSHTRFLPLRNPMEPCPLPVDVFIQHDYQQNFSEVSLPEEGKAVTVRTWDFGPFPPAWVKKINEEFDQLWVHTRWIRENAIRGGVRPEKVYVVPLGFDELTFRPRGPIHHLPTRKSFRFLFVGRTVIRKGVDILLRAYTTAFGPGDDVVLVIKDNPSDVFYQGIDIREEIVSLARRVDTPEILYLDGFLTKQQLASVYRACDVGVFPYRAEGFCLPIIEAMACGKPCIVPNFGAALDFCGPRNSFPVDVRRIQLPVARSFAINTLGFEEEVHEVDFCEVPVDRLAARMRAVYEDHKMVSLKGRRAALTARTRFTWHNSTRTMQALIGKMPEKSVPVRLANRRRLFRENERTLEAARSLFLDRMGSETR